MEPRMKPFILNRTDERNTKSVGGILLYAALFFIVTRIAAMLLQKSGAALYEWGWGSMPRGCSARVRRNRWFPKWDGAPCRTCYCSHRSSKSVLSGWGFRSGGGI